MVTLLASLVGFLSSLLPEIIKFLKDINDKRHELAVFEKQIEYNRQARGKTVEEIHINKDMHEQASLYATYNSNIAWVDAINGMVRPVLAYCFFGLYMTVKYMQYRAISESGLLIDLIDIIWNVDDQAIFAGVISFYYGQRTFKNFWRPHA